MDKQTIGEVMSSDPPIYSGFSSATGFFGRILGGSIRLFTGGDVNHAFFVFWSPEFDTWLTVGANANGVTIMSVGEFCKTREINYLFAPIGWSIWDGMRAHVKDLDKHYNYTGLFGMANVEIIKKIVGRPGLNFLNDRDDLFCSEWCAMVLRAGMGMNRALKFLPNYKDNQIDPSTLRDAEKASSFFASVPVSVVMKKPFLLAA